ncbi:MAG TPA: hypothetical protein VGJ21_01685 [Terracidiphilus sp.]|jgi:hypothetical protein
MSHLQTAARHLDFLPDDDIIARLATLKYFGEENAQIGRKTGLMKKVHQFHNWFARNGLIQYQPQRVGMGDHVPIPSPSVPESWSAGNVAQKAVAGLFEPLLFDTGPANLKIKTAGEIAGASTVDGLAQISQALMTDAGSARIAAQIAQQSENELAPFIAGRPQREQVQIVTNYMRQGRENFWQHASAERNMNADQIQAWRADPNGYRLPNGLPPKPLRSSRIDPDQFQQIEGLEWQNRRRARGPTQP